MYFEETKKVMVASIAAALLNVVLNALLIFYNTVGGMIGGLMYWKEQLQRMKHICV